MIRSLLFWVLLLSAGNVSADRAVQNCNAAQTKPQESATLTLSVSGSSTTAAGALEEFEAKMKKSEEKAAQLGNVSLKLQSNNLSVNNVSNYYGDKGPVMYQYSGSASYTVPDAKLAARLVDELSKAGIAASMNSNMYINYSASCSG